jgi:hypothetical protein
MTSSRMMGHWWREVVAMVMVMMIDQGCRWSTMMMMVVKEPARGACRGGADLAPTSTCGGG